MKNVAVALLFSSLAASQAVAQMKPWCSQPLFGPTAQPYPAPTWTQLGAVPDVENLSTNFQLAKNLRLLISAMEQTIAQIESGKSLAGTGDIDGVCLCNCNHDAAYWAGFLRNTAKTQAESALNEALDQYLKRLDAKAKALQTTVYDTVPNFRKDVENIIRNTCEPMYTCDPKAGIPIGDIYEQESALAQNEIESIFLATLNKNGFLEIKKKAEDLKSDAENLLNRVGSNLFTLSGAQVLSEFEALEVRLADLVQEAIAGTEKTVTELVKNLGPSIQQVVDKVGGDLRTKLDADAKTFETLDSQIKAAVEKRVQAIKTAVKDLYDTAVDRKAVLGDFKQRFENGILQSLGSIKGCYGKTKKSECTAAAFCEGRPPGKLFNNDDLTLPLWFPTEAFKDGRTALRWALSAIDWLETVKKVLNSEQTSASTQRMKDLVAQLKNGAEILEKLKKYVDLYTDGYHQGAYSNLRADLTSCVAYGGSGLMAELFNTSGGDFRGGANYLSANLTKDNQVQFRSSGLGLYVNGRHLPLAPGVSLVAEVDLWHLLDRHYPFGLGRGKETTGWEMNPGDLAVFNLVKKEDLDKICCTATNTTDCITCPITGSSFLHKGFYPVQYGSRMWPRTNVTYESDERIAAAVGAGLNHDLKMKTRYWSGAPIPVWIGTITPWMSLDAGVGWHYEANRFRNTLLEQINKGLPETAKITKSEFSRDAEPFQAPDASLDTSNGAEVKPKLGANVLLGFPIAKFAEVGITASLYLGVDVVVEGSGGIIDLDRGLVDSLQQSNPKGSDCRPKVVDQGRRVCSNEFFKRPERCANVAEADRKNCVDLSSTSEPAGPFSTATYDCEKGQCGTKGYCKEGKKIIAHDVTREQCETAVLGSCIAPYQEPNRGGDPAVIPEMVWTGPPFGLYPSPYRETQLALAQGEAAKRTTQSDCVAAGWCLNFKYAPGITAAPYLGSFTGVAASADQCPPLYYENLSSAPVKPPAGRSLRPSHFFRFEWRPVTIDPAKKRVFYPYQCVDDPRPTVEGWQGLDCNPTQFGYPSACPGGTCACDPAGPPCPVGQICLEGACVPKCSASSPCAEGRKCVNGGCVLANGVPFAEQVVYRMRQSNAPQHTVATYGLDKLITSVVAGVGVNAGLRYRLFKNWKEKTVLDKKWSWTLVAFPGVKHQLGLEAQYQDDCNPAGSVTNHQPDLVKRHPGNVKSVDLVKWCKPAMAADEQNPAEMPTVDETIGASIDETLKFGADLGVDYWARGQMCIGGKTIDQYLAGFENDPLALWKKLKCSYTRKGVKRTLPCANGGELQTALIGALGCLDTSGPDALPLNATLLSLLPNPTTWLLPGTNVLDAKKLFVDDEGALDRTNLDPAVLALEVKGFALQSWLNALSVCLDDAPAGRFNDADLDLALDLKKEDLQPCGGTCCLNGICSEVKSPAECAGVFRPVTTCASAPACPVVSAPPPKGSCIVFGKCQEVVAAAECQGSWFYPGRTCSQIPTGGPPGCIPLVTNETAWWSFDEKTNPSKDRALFDNAATHVGTPAFQPGVSGGAICFNDRESYATVADHPEIDFSGTCPSAESFTLSFWIRISSAGSGVVPVLDKRGQRSNFNSGYHVFLYNGRPGFQLASGVGPLACGASPSSPCTNEFTNVPVADGQWHFIAIRVVRCGPDARGTIFVDGRPVYTFKPREGELANDAPLTIGRNFKGCLDELAIIKAALTDYEIRALYQSGPRGRCRTAPCALDAGLSNAFNTYGRRAVLAQTFTPSTTGYVTQVTHGLQTGGGAVTSYDLLITTTDSNGLPAWTGGPLTTPNVLYSATGLTTFAGSGIVNGAVPIPAARRLLLQAGVRYALILVPGGPPTAAMMWRGNSGASTYPAGSAYQLVGGTWVVPAIGPKDHGFRIDGACE